MYALDPPLRYFTLTGGRIVVTRPCLCTYTFISSHSKTGSPRLPFLSQAAGISRSCPSVPHTGGVRAASVSPRLWITCRRSRPLVLPHRTEVPALWRSGACLTQPAAALLGVLGWPGWDEILSVSCLGALTCAHPLLGGPSSPCRLPLRLVTSFLVLRCQLCCHFSWEAIPELSAPPTKPFPPPHPPAAFCTTWFPHRGTSSSPGRVTTAVASRSGAVRFACSSSLST